MMSLAIMSKGLRVSCAALLLVLPLGVLSAEFDGGKADPLPPSPVSASAEADKAALSLAQASSEEGDALYAGTSTWLLLSIALLGAIAVKRRPADTRS